MRLSPTQEQMDYLASLGIGNDPAMAKRRKGKGTDDQRAVLELEISAVKLWTLLLLVLVFILIWVDSSWGRQCKDAAGYICDDNLTLAILGDGAAPELSNGLWLDVGQDHDKVAVQEFPEDVDTESKGTVT